MHKIKFSYIFDEEIDRVYECFTDMRINIGITFKDVISNLKFSKGERFDVENSEFSAIWKNYYEIKMVVENVKKEPFFRTYTNKALYIDKIPTKISLIYNFYWNSMDEKTIFIMEFAYDDEFFCDLFKNEYNIHDKIKICSNVEKYLNSIVKGLENFNSVFINSSFENIWKNISNPKSLFNILFKDFITICNDVQINLDTEIIIYANTSNSANPIPLIKLKVEGINISPKYCKISFISCQKLSLPNQKIVISIQMLDKHKTFFTVNIKILECITHEALVNIRKLWKKKIAEFVNFFESKNKKHNLKKKIK
jgi:hypothetical protein